MAQANFSVECGFCMLCDGNLIEPKTLPCDHIHCEGCLRACLGNLGIVQCPTCSEAFDVDLDRLPNASIEGDNSPPCDICEHKEIHNQPAINYCTSCTKKYCAKHLELHDDDHEDHHKIEMSDYKREARKLQIGYCSEHKEVEYGRGCKVCLTVFCAYCKVETDGCTNGQAHELLTLDQLVTELTKDMNRLKVEIINKEEKLSALFKQISKAISDYQKSTDEMIETLHQTRDRQYDNLEAELIKLRTQSQSEMKRYMEEDVGIKLSELSNQRLKIEAKLRGSHEMDIVNGYLDVRDEIKRLISEEMSSFQLKNSVFLVCRDESRDIEAQLVPSPEDNIDWECGPAIPEPLPKSLTLVRSVQVYGGCVSVSHYKGNTYAGLFRNGIHKIDENFQLVNSFINPGACVYGVTVYKDRVYSLMAWRPYTVRVHSLTGEYITQWQHTDCASVYVSDFVNQLVIVSDQVVVPDKVNRKLTVYSLTGQMLHNFPCPQSITSQVALCASSSDSVVVSDHGSSQVFKVNITNGDVIWTSTEVVNPQGVTCLGQTYVFVFSEASKKIHILSAVTGKVITELAYGDFGGSAPDLHISGRTLIVPFNDSVRFYQLNQ